mmetsp:Transcript_2647/g.5623  ORF Transcript_2647/g.5623 Transcript_2647/m.5623 type:complete len:223 (-) Transcript_2647:504-1172(-)|eukprot:CAMPEP_0172198650 /NCGR_PEP_ID=MMETSP1050-20130122/28216_1 /TAXON_ID=233186 /ORGANISM="Cryptomonas curvata, Strain CCAP979/52" /LENGTH=222 /DNA_ID=CAMNT_0012875517 /DNA_START=264 /DNA_END=932 /DNA_ORIENTATION=+
MLKLNLNELNASDTVAAADAKIADLRTSLTQQPKHPSSHRDLVLFFCMLLPPFSLASGPSVTFSRCDSMLKIANHECRWRAWIYLPSSLHLSDARGSLAGIEFSRALLSALLAAPQLRQRIHPRWYTVFSTVQACLRSTLAVSTAVCGCHATKGTDRLSTGSARPLTRQNPMPPFIFGLAAQVLVSADSGRIIVRTVEARGVWSTVLQADDSGLVVFCRRNK